MSAFHYNNLTAAERHLNTCTTTLVPVEDEHGATTGLDSRTLGIVYAVILSALGLAGAILNIVVIFGVTGNARLGTTVNKLLIWICGFALMEGTLGILMKVLILGE